MADFLINYVSNRKITYDDLIQDMNSRKYYYRYILEENPYEVFINILGGMVNRSNIELLDSDFSPKEIEKLGINYDNLKTDLILNLKTFITKDDLIRTLFELDSESMITLFTSGTTGKPKKITHSFRNIIRAIKIDDKFQKDIWAFAYNPTHFAGIQVFFQAVLNGNAIVFIFGADNKSIQNAFYREKITRISATPSFYKNILPLIEGEVLSVKSVTSGGEKFESKLIKYVESIFPNARIRNVYASTEAGSLFSTQEDFFIIPDRIKEKVKISNNSELLIHRSLLGSSDDLEIQDDYYNTKDIVEFVNDNSFRFISRNSDFVNVGGYRVNPLEIEEIILELDIVNDVLVYGRKNSVIGNLLVAEIIKADINMPDEIIKNTIVDYLCDKVQSWKVPKIYKIVSQIEKTRTGKKVRKK